MRQEMHLPFFLLLFLLPHEAFSAAAGGCNRRCGSSPVVPYPFGFSAGCPIQLSCNATASTPFLINTTAAMVPIQSFNSTNSTLRVALQPSCSRDVFDAKRSLSGANYGVSSRTGLYLRGSCHNSSSICSVPADVMSRMLRTAQCAGNDTAVTCIMSTPATLFLQWKNVENSRCSEVLTTAVYGDTPEAVMSLEFGVAELGWWLNGTCDGGGRRQCAANATCSDVETPSGSPGYRCACPDGMDGDGFAAGDGCKPAKISSRSRSRRGYLVLVAVAEGPIGQARRLKEFVDPSLHDVSFCSRALPHCLSLPARRHILSQQRGMRSCVRAAQLCIQEKPDLAARHAGGHPGAEAQEGEGVAPAPVALHQEELAVRRR